MLDVRNTQDVGVIERVRVGREVNHSPHLVSLAAEIDGRLCVATLSPREAFDMASVLLAMAAEAAAHSVLTNAGEDA